MIKRRFFCSTGKEYKIQISVPISKSLQKHPQPMYVLEEIWGSRELHDPLSHPSQKYLLILLYNKCCDDSITGLRHRESEHTSSRIVV